jgi:hypothetical protein
MGSVPAAVVGQTMGDDEIGARLTRLMLENARHS